MGLLVALLLEGTYGVWNATDQERAALATETQQLPRACLDFELRRGSGSELFLFIHNLGPGEARAISVGGLLDSGTFENISGFANIIPPNTEQGLLIDPNGRHIILGSSQWELEVDWEDGDGRHEKETFVATRRT